MKCLIQYVSSASVAVDGQIVGQINRGYCILIGFRVGDSQKEVKQMAKKLIKLRTIPDTNGKINSSIHDIKGELLLIPQFTLYADTTKGHRPNFSYAASPAAANKLFESFVKEVKKSRLKVQIGQFGAHMEVSLTNNGPITITLEN